MTNVVTPSRHGSSGEYAGPPKSWFFGEDWLERDIEAVFRPRWLIAGHAAELAALGPNGYLTFSLGRYNALIRRGDDGTLRAYHNVCPHRGAVLCDEPQGAATGKTITCPYHLWTFSVDDGGLLSAREMHPEFNRSDFGLKSVHVDEWKGLIFVCIADAPTMSLDRFLEPADFAAYDFGDMKLAASKADVIEANWKIVVENNHECYHCAVNHPELMEVYDWRDMATDDFDGVVARRLGGPEVYGRPTRSANTVKGARVCAVPTPTLPGRSPADPMEAANVSIEPGAVINLSRDTGWLFVPKPIGPEQTELRQYWFVAREAVEGRDYDRESVMEFFDVTMQQDRVLCERVQRGMRNPAYEPGPMNRIHQSSNSAWYHWYEAQIRAVFPDSVEPRATLTP